MKGVVIEGVVGVGFTRKRKGKKVVKPCGPKRMIVAIVVTAM
jgi:hypothetical protein